MNQSRPGNSIRGIELRYLLTLVLVESGHDLTISQLGSEVTRRGGSVRGRPSKTVSDALRSEVRRGRVQRVARGTYRSGTVSRQTKSRMKKRLAGLANSEARVAAHDRAAAYGRGRDPPPDCRTR